MCVNENMLYGMYNVDNMTIAPDTADELTYYWQTQTH